MKAFAVGVALFVAQAALLGPLLAHCVRARPPLRVRVAPDARIADGEVPAPLADRVSLTVDDVPVPRGASLTLPPGLHRAEWSLEYRGPYRRRVGRTVLDAPARAPSDPPCGITVHVGQRFLDETVEPIAREILARRLDGIGHWTIGRFRDVPRLELRWIAPPGVDGMLHLDVAIRFTRAEVVAAVAAIPEIVDGALRIRPLVTARVELKNWFVRMGARVLSSLDLVDKDREATAYITTEVENALALLEGLTLPSLELPGAPLGVRFCPSRAIAIATGDRMSIPLAFDPPAPIARGASGGTAPAPRLDAPLGLTVDLDALNTILHHLWRTGALDALLRDHRAAELFNTHPAVRDLLTLRVADLRFAIPPTLQRAPGRRAFSLATEWSLSLTDGVRATPARLYARIAFDVAAAPGGSVVASVTPDELSSDLARTVALTCHPAPDLLDPCFADVVDAIAREIRVNREAVHAFATDRFARTFESLAHGFALQVEDRTYAIAPVGIRAEPTESTVEVHVSLVARAPGN